MFDTPEGEGPIWTPKQSESLDLLCRMLFTAMERAQAVAEDTMKLYALPSALLAKEIVTEGNWPKPKRNSEPGPRSSGCCLLSSKRSRTG
jgi:hypothetical protein